MSKQKKNKTLSRSSSASSLVSNTSSLINDDEDINIDKIEFIPIRPKKNKRDEMAEMFRDSPVPDIFKGPIPDIKNVKENLKKRKEGWFKIRPKKGGSPKKKSQKKRDLPKDDDFDNFDEVNLDFTSNKKKNYPFLAEVPTHEEMVKTFKKLKNEGWFEKEPKEPEEPKKYKTGGKTTKKKYNKLKCKTKKIKLK